MSPEVVLMSKLSTPFFGLIPRSMMNRLFDEVLLFSTIGFFADTPLKL